MSLYKKLSEPLIWKRIFYERLTEPLHLNFISLFVAAFGSYPLKVEFDLVLRAQYAFGVLSAAKRALQYGIKEITVIEFGVSSGAGLLNMSSLSEHAERATGVKIRVAGFDSGAGMPAPLDFRDHPDMYVRGDFPMDFAKLRQKLPARTSLIIAPWSRQLRNSLRHSTLRSDSWSLTSTIIVRPKRLCRSLPARQRVTCPWSQSMWMTSTPSYTIHRAENCSPSKSLTLNTRCERSNDSLCSRTRGSSNEPTG